MVDEILPEIMKRRQAKALGLKRYFTNKPCTRGHIAERWVVCGGCSTCKLDDALSWKNRNREHCKAWSMNWRQENLEHCVAKRKKKYADNRATELAAMKDWRERNLDLAKKISNDYKKNNPEKAKACGHNRRALLLRAGIHTGEEIIELRLKQKGRCAGCLIKLNRYHVDHVIALARGGSNTIDNLQLLCARCNLTKSAKDPIVWAQQNGRLL